MYCSSHKKSFRGDWFWSHLENSKADPNTSNLASEMEEKRKEIRLLFQQCETAMQREKDLENKFKDLEMQHKLHSNADKHVTRTNYPNPQGPSIASHTFSNHPQTVANTEAIRRLEMYGSASSDNDTTTTDDEGESLTVEELERCARQIQRLLYRIENVQDGISGGRVVKHSRKRRMYKTYQRFCRKFEQNLGNSRPNQSVPKRQSTMISAMSRHPTFMRIFGTWQKHLRQQGIQSHSLATVCRTR
jgi:hypothetical protein